MKKIIITGGCGFIGSNLTDFLINNGYKIYIIDNFSNNKITKPNKKSKLYKLDIRNINQIKNINNIHAVIHLAGENIGKRWTAQRRQELMTSRREATKLLVNHLQGLDAFSAITLPSNGGFG